jgi:16S rRNA (adenine1518-N6/adenine1519-N6)-dimethyltransferase
MNIQQLRDALALIEKNPNPALGQNFFINDEKLSEIAKILPENRTVIEVGAGLGALTRFLIEFSEKVYAIEKDFALYSWLNENLISSNAEIIHGDFLDVSLPSLPHNFLAAGNLPYSVTTPICEKLISLLPEQMLLMVQREAADRFFAQPSKKQYGALSVLSQIYYSARTLCELAPNCYYPEPKVYSVVIHFTKRNDIPEIAPAELSHFVKQCLAMRRKTLVNNLKGIPNLENIMRENDISPSARGETLSPKQFVRLYLSLFA